MSFYFFTVFSSSVMLFKYSWVLVWFPFIISICSFWALTIGAIKKEWTINKSNIDKVYVFGNYIKETFNKLKKQKKGEIFKKLNYLERVFKKDLNNKDIVMIKGSNATGLFKFSQKIKKGKMHAI